jgi:hypothetical protein
MDANAAFEELPSPLVNTTSLGRIYSQRGIPRKALPHPGVARDVTRSVPAGPSLGLEFSTEVVKASLVKG